MIKKKAVNDSGEVAKIIRNRGTLSQMEFNSIVAVVKIVLRAYDEYTEYNTPIIDRKELEGHVIDKLMVKDQVFGVTHELLGKINLYSTEFELKKRGLLKKDN